MKTSLIMLAFALNRITGHGFLVLHLSGNAVSRDFPTFAVYLRFRSAVILTFIDDMCCVRGKLSPRCSDSATVASCMLDTKSHYRFHRNCPVTPLTRSSQFSRHFVRL